MCDENLFCVPWPLNLSLYVCVCVNKSTKLRRVRYSRIWNEYRNISTSLHVNKKRALCVCKRAILCVHLSCCPSERMSFFPPLVCLFVPQKTIGPKSASFTASDEFIKNISIPLSLSSPSIIFQLSFSPPSPLPLFFSFNVWFFHSFTVFLEVSSLVRLLSQQAVFALLSFYFTPIQFLPPFWIFFPLFSKRL